MTARLNENQITEVEAVYLCLLEIDLSIDFKIALIRKIYDENLYMYVYLEWLIFRWLPLYARFKTHLPSRRVV